MFDSLTADPRAAVRVCDAIASMCLLAAAVFAVFDRRRGEPLLHPRLPASRRVMSFAVGYLLALAGAIAWASASQPVVSFAVTVVLCWSWTVLLSRWSEWTGAALGIAAWGGVLAAAGAQRFLVLALLLTSFGYVFFEYHRRRPPNLP